MTRRQEVASWKLKFENAAVFNLVGMTEVDAQPIELVKTKN